MNIFVNVRSVGVRLFQQRMYTVLQQEPKHQAQNYKFQINSVRQSINGSVWRVNSRHVVCDLFGA